MIATFNGIFERVHRMAVPTIAAVHGACLGGGMEVAMACDIIVAAPKAVFGQPEIKLGFFPPYAAIRLPQLVGPARAVEICTTGRRYKADAAHRMGLVAHLSGEENFAETLDSIVDEIKACSPLIIRLNKRAVNRPPGTGIQAGPFQCQRSVFEYPDENRRHPGRYKKFRGKTSAAVEKQVMRPATAEEMVKMVYFSNDSISSFDSQRSRHD